MSAHVRSLLEGALRRSGIDKEVLAARIVEEAQRVLRDIFGHEIAQDILPTSFSRGELCVHASTPIAGVELRQHEERLLGELRKKFPRTPIHRLTIAPSKKGSRTSYRTTTER